MRCHLDFAAALADVETGAARRILDTKSIEASDKEV